jgi:hypothetical protein
MASFAARLEDILQEKAEISKVEEEKKQSELLVQEQMRSKQLQKERNNLF